MWSDPRASLDNVSVGTSLVTGTVVDLLGVRFSHSVQYNVNLTASATVDLSLQGSLDGVNWYDMGANVFDYGSPVGAAQYNWPPVFVTEKPAAYLRVVGTVSSGSSTNVVTAYVTSDLES